MPESILTVLKLLLLALLYLFFLRVLRAVWAETASTDDSTLTAVPAAQRAPRAARPEPATLATGRLKVVAPPADRGQVYELGDEVTVGRAPGCQVSLAGDSTVSQLHARIWRSEGRLMVEDLGSTNGTFLNRKKLTGTHPLRAGDRIQVGQTVLEVAT